MINLVNLSEYINELQKTEVDKIISARFDCMSIYCCVCKEMSRGIRGNMYIRKVLICIKGTKNIE